LTDNTEPADLGWSIVEMLGHRRVAGYVREQTVAGAGFLRIDGPNGGRTQLVSPGSIYAIHPTTEEIVRRVAGQWATAPVSRFELERGRQPDTSTVEDQMQAAGEEYEDPWGVGGDDD